MDTERPDPQRMLLVPRLERAGEDPRYLLVRWRDWPPPALLALDPPADADALQQAIVETLNHRIGVTPTGPALVSDERRPVRMRLTTRGGEGMGWLRVAAIRVEGTPEPDALLEGVSELSLEDALAALTSDVERLALSTAARLLDGGVASA